MGYMRDVDIVWEDLLDAFGNADEEKVFFLDRETGEVFSVPLDYEDDAFWEEIEAEPDRFLRIPVFDYEQERLMLYEFIQSLADGQLKHVLERAYSGQRPYGRLDEILSFYPEEFDRLLAIREDILSDRIRHWLEEHDIFHSGEI